MFCEEVKLNFKEMLLVIPKGMTCKLHSTTKCAGNLVIKMQYILAISYLHVHH